MFLCIIEYNILFRISVSVNLVCHWKRSRFPQVWSKMQILLTLAAKQAISPSGFKLFEDANFVASNEAGGAFAYKKQHPG